VTPELVVISSRNAEFFTCTEETNTFKDIGGDEYEDGSSYILV
jgi:hypothetical protein